MRANVFVDFCFALFNCFFLNTGIYHGSKISSGTGIGEK